MNDVTPAQDITDEMVWATAEAAFKHLRHGAYEFVDFADIDEIARHDWLLAARDGLTAGLAGRVVVDLPEPDDTDEYGPRWDTERDMPIRVEVDGGSPAVWDCDADMAPEDAERHGLALVAAAREARRLAASPKGGETND